METPPIELTPKQKDILATLSRQTGKPAPALLEEALEGLQQERALLPPEERASALPPRKPFWQKALEASQRLPDAELDHLPPDLAAQVDHYIYGTPKR